jgi:hypothetical protein
MDLTTQRQPNRAGTGMQKADGWCKLQGDPTARLVLGTAVAKYPQLVHQYPSRRQAQVQATLAQLAAI